MDPSKLLMGGVVLLGGYAAYKMLQTSSKMPSSYPLGEQGPKEGAIDASGLTLLGDPLSMKKGQYYRGRLELPSARLQPHPPFNADGDQTGIAQALGALGFSDVRIFMSPSDAPSGWPAGTLAASREGTRWFQGKWSQEAMQLPRPTQLRLLWVTRTP